MNSEREYVVELFEKNFKNFKNKSIAIYGVGQNTKAILEECVDFNIVVLLDSAIKGQMLWGKEVIGHEQLKNYNIDIIIIVARYSNISIIYNRIASSCNENNVIVYDINGRELKQNGVNECLFIDKEINKSELLELISKNEVISFDVFDTLLMRKTLHPKDVFEIVEIRGRKKGLPSIDFAELRVKAENFCNMNFVPHIFQIYEEMQNMGNISIEISKEYMDLEFEIEKEIIVVRDDIQDIFKYILNTEKKAYLLSDMYWPNSYLKEILSGVGIRDYEKLFVSCDYGKTKGTGLYDCLKEEVKADSYLHIGDNYEIDCIMAERSGVSSYHILSAYEMLKISSCKELLNLEMQMDLSARYMVGAYIAKAFSSPFVFEKTKGKVFVNKEKDFGYLYLAPIITQYLLWLKENISINNSTVLFASRDGYILKELFDYMQNHETIYFLTSRMNAVLTGTLSEEDLIFEMNLPFSGEPEDMLKRRFFLKEDDILKKEYGEELQDYILRHKERIFDISSYYRKNMNKYMKSTVDTNKEFYWVDFVASGTCQYFFEKIIKKPVNGLYFYRFLTDSKEKSSLNIKTLYEQTYAYSQGQWLLRMYIFLENIITSYQPTLKCFDVEGAPVFLEEKRTTSQIDYLKEIHLGITEYFKEFISLGLEKTYLLEIPDILLGSIRNEVSNLEIKYIEDNSLEDEFANRTFTMKPMLGE